MHRLPVPAWNRLVRPAAIVPAVAVALVCWPASAGAATRTVTAVADTYTTATAARANFGRSRVLLVDGRPRATTFLRFDLGRGGGHVASVTLRLYRRSPRRAPVGFRAVSATRWSETALTHRTARRRSDARVATARYAGSWVEIDVSGLAGADGVLGVALIGTTSRGVRFASRESGLRRAPRLVVETAASVAGPEAPEPSLQPQPDPDPDRAGGPVAPPLSGALFGAWTSDSTGLTMEQREAQLGARYRIVHRYHDWNDAFPTSEERAWAGDGRILLINWVSRIYGATTVIPWSEIAAGRHDGAIDARAEAITGLGVPVMLTFMHEPEDEVGPEYGSAADFAAAFRHVRARFEAAGATNVSWVWNVMGYSGYSEMYAGGLYPGDDAVDWIAWDPYNWHTCRGNPWRTFTERVASFYGWLLANGHADKPFMLAEFGTTEHEHDPLAKGRWFQDALASLRDGAFPNLKALVYFDSLKNGCDWRVDSSSGSLDGYRALATDAFMNP